MAKEPDKHTQDDESHDTLAVSDKRRVKPAGILANRGVLLVLSSNFFGRSFALHSRRMVVGRSSDCDIHLDDPLISKTHCVITAEEDGTFSVEDLDSTNRTFLNRKPVSKKTPLFYGDRLILGNTIIRFFLEEKLDRS
jgi:pSer/pThr/pTyr-binding forkhead associated (FHA) protein